MIRLPHIFKVIALVLAFVFFATVAKAANLVWQKEGVIFSDNTVHNVEVVTLEDGRYRMYFHQGTQMKSAISQDAKAFTIEDGVRLEGSMPALVRLSDGRWRMYYQTLEDGQGVFKSAVSNDGLTWSIEPGVRLTPGGTYDPDNIVHPSVIELPQDGYRMYYDGEVTKTEQEFTWRILSATSSNGLVWTKDEGVRINTEEEPLVADLVWSSHASYDELTGVYELYFSVQSPEVKDGIYLATSSDGLFFDIVETPQLAPETESGEFGAGGQIGSYQDPFVLEIETGKRIYYWVAGSGIYSAILTEGETQEGPEQSPSALQQLLDKVGVTLPTVSLPQNWELYIVPSILLGAGAAIFIVFWRARKKRDRR